jgi:tryptophan synthase alpha subunit
VAENKKMIRLMARLGVDFIELQIPFSDPMADGPTIMRANTHALAGKARVQDAFLLMEELAKEINPPLLFMGYFNTVLHYGTKKFFQDAKKAGCGGVIFPDIPLEEEPRERFIEYAEKYHIEHIRVLSPASTAERIRRNAKVACGFVYFVGRKGTTGAQGTLDSALSLSLRELKKYIKIPIAVGFGISSGKHIEALRGKVEMAVIGSALLDVYDAAERGRGFQAVEAFLKPLITVARGKG